MFLTDIFVIINAARRIKKIAFIKEKSHVSTWDFFYQALKGSCFTCKSLA